MRKPDSYYSLLKESSEVLESLLKTMGGCDHEVGICMCKEYNLVDKIYFKLRREKNKHYDNNNTNKRYRKKIRNMS